MPLALPRRLAAILSILLLTLCGCAVAPVADTSARVPMAGAQFSAELHGGQQAISGASIQLYAVSDVAVGQPSTPLLFPVPVSNAKGYLTLPPYTCPSAGTLVYLTGSQGNPGLGAGANNPNLDLMVALGPCGNLTPTTFVALNELTTVASVFSLAPFASSATSIGSSPSAAPELAAAFAQINELVNTARGSIPGPNLPAGYTAPTTQLTTLADILAPCINSAGGSAGDGSACGTLFANAHVPNEPAPTDTIVAALNMARNPLLNVAPLFGLVSSTSPYQPTLSSAPFDWDVLVQPSSAVPVAQRAHLLGEYLLTEGQGTLATDTSGLGNNGTIAGATWEGSADLNFTKNPANRNFISVPGALNAANTWQLALYVPPYGFAQYPQAPGYGQASDFPGNPSPLCGTTSAQTCFITSQSFNTVSPHLLAFNTSSTEATPALTAGWHIVTLVSGQAGALDHIFYDGAEVSSYRHQGSGMFQPSTSGNYQIGGSSFAYDTWFVGKVAATWAWSTSLPSADVATSAAAALAFIQSKGVTSEFSPVVRTAPLIVGGIDSRTAGSGLTTQKPWINNLSLTDPTYTVTNPSIRGATLYDTLAMYDLLLAPQIQANTAPTIEIFWGGVNDFATSTLPSATIAASMQGLVAKAKALGARVIVATEISSVYGDQPKAGLDTLLRANALAWGADNLVDLATIPQIGADGAYQSSYFNSDHLHPNDSAEPLITAAMTNSINELLGSTAAAHHTASTTAYTEEAGDDFLDLSPTQGALQTITLPDCIGYSLPRHLFNLSATPAAVLTQDNEALSGSGLVSSGASATFTPIPGSYATGGCSWQQSN